jgi:hypothetical protein
MNVTIAPTPPEPETQPQAPPKPWTFLDEYGRQLANHAERIAVVESKQSSFSESLSRIEATVHDGMVRLGSKIDRINGWLLGSVFTLCLVLLGLVINLLRQRP